jgi:hypothetical protein
MNLPVALVAIGLNPSPTMQYGQRTTGSAIVASIGTCEGGREIFAAETSPRPTLIHAPFLRCSTEMAFEKRRKYTARTRRVQ